MKQTNNILLCLHLVNYHQGFPIIVELLLKLELWVIPTFMLIRRKRALFLGQSSIFAFKFGFPERV